MTDTSPFLTDVHAAVQTITLNQPAKFNALSSAMLGALDAALRAADRDSAVRTIVLTGAGKGFCSGADLTGFNIDDGPLDLGESLRKGFNPITLRLRSTEKPVLAAINGVAAGAGLSLALACDLRYAAESARLVLAFVRIGLVPDAGSMYFLPRLVGAATALEMAWTGDPMTAEEGRSAGIVNRVLPDDQVLSYTQELAQRLARGPARTLGLIKRAVNQSHELSLERVLEMEASYQTLAARHADFAEGIAAFREKRPPKFS
jgi:2-(1,2-epoxy-1,2-dihydrophenyl)acetyl-CoA isomerase